MNILNSKILDKIEKEISTVLPFNIDDEWISNAISCKDKTITFDSVDSINKPALDLIYRGGKRWRPLVMVLTTGALNGDVENAIKLSPIVEIIHNGTLLIDDIEDKAIERRGKKAVHLIYGEDMTINSGNHLYFIPTTLIENLEFTDKIKLKIYKSYTSNMRRLHFGQGLDIQWHNNDNYIPKVEEYIQMCKFKTGCLASMSGELGAICGNATIEQAEELRLIWEQIGVGFQILDDIKNITTGNPGKKRGDDIVEGKKSLPLILYCSKNDDKTIFKYIANAKKKGIIKGNKSVEKAINILSESGSIVEATKIALELLNSSTKQIENILPNNEYKESLIYIIDDFIKKMSPKII